MNRFNGTIFNGVFALTADSTGNIYAGGDFYSPGDYIAKWNASTSTWTALGSGMNSNVWALTTDASGNLYAGGDFTTAGGVTVNRIAKWNGSTWTALGTAPDTGMNGRVLALTTDASGNLYAGGNFTTAGGVTVNRIAKWNGTSWSALGTGMNMTVTALAFDAGNLYAGGLFTQVNGVAINRVAQWNGNSWSALGDGLNDTVNALATDAGNLYAGGHFTKAGEVTVNRIAKWNGTSWSALGGGVTASGERISTLRVDTAANVYAAGVFLNIDGVPANRIAKWNGTSWSALGTGMNSNVFALTQDSNGTLYAGGSFTTAGGTSVNRIASLSLASPALDPTFDTPMRADNGFTVNVTNYDASYTWTPSVSTGSVSAGTPSGSTLPLTVTGLSNGSTATVTVTTSRSGYSNGSTTVVGQAKSPQAVTWSPVTAISTASATVTPSSLASGPVGGGSISYLVDSFSTTACSVDPSTAVLTVSGTGECVVRATAEATADYLQGSTVVTFSLSKAPQPVAWAPSTALTLPGATVTPAAASAPAGGGSITYSIEDAGTTGCSVDSGSGALTYTAAGECVVRASAEATTGYVVGYTDVTFTIAKATPTLSWNPDLVQVLPNNSTTFSAATTSSDGAITYEVTDAGTTSCSLPNSSSRDLSFATEGSCTVKVTVVGTTDYDEVTSVKTFAIYKSAQTITWAPTTSLDLATLSTSLGSASSSGDGTLSYEVTSAGGTGCAIADPSQPDLTYTSAGTCTVTATSASTINYAQATQSAIIRITQAAPTITWSPTTALTMPAATITPTPATSDGGTITYTVTSDTGAACSFAAGDLTYTDTGQCTITATSAATSRYTAGSASVTFTVSLAPQTITAATTSSTLRPGGTATLSHTGSSGSGAIAWANATPGICTLTGTTVTADANGSCTLTVSIDPDGTYAAASDTITITVSTPPPPGGGGGSSGGGSSGGSGGSSSIGGASTPGDSGSSSGISGSAAAGGGSNTGGDVQSQDDVAVPGTGSSTRGRALPPPPEDVDVQRIPGRARSSVLIKQPAGAAGLQVASTVVVVRNAQGKVISRINVALKKGQGEIEVTVPFVADGYTVDVYNVNDVGVSTGALTRSPLIRATTITKRTTSGQPSLFGAMLGKPIIFNGGSAALDAQDRKQLRAIARKAKASNERLFVTGFARKGGGTKSELASLSTKRANAAARYLSKQGVRVWIRYWGAGSLNGTGDASDRRVEVRTSAKPIPRTLVP